MPLIAIVTIIIAAGLFTGLGGDLSSGGLVVAILGAGGVLVMRRRSVVVIALALLAAASVLGGDAIRRHDARCLADAARSRMWMVRLDGEAAPGAYVHGRMIAGGCELDIAVSVSRGRARDGSIARVRGEPAESRRGMMIRRADVTESEPPSGLAAARARARRAVDATFRRDAPVARALLVADTRLLSPEIRERYAAAGLIHALSISGLHVGIIAAAAQLLFGAARLSVRAALIATMATITVYIAVLGFPAPACRAAAMLGVVAAARIAQRPTSAWGALALGALLPLAQPRTILDLGYHLSVAGVAALMGAGAFSRRVLAPRLRGWRLSIARDLTASTIATLATAPLVAASFGVVSMVGPLTNLVAGPLFVLLQPMLFLALLTAPLEPVAHFIADAAQPLLRLLDAIAGAGAAAPFATLGVNPSAAASIVAGITAMAGVVACVSRFPMRPALVGVGGLALLAWLPMLPGASGEVELHAIDVGQGDAIALRTDRGRWILMDAGRQWTGGDEGRATVLPHLRRRGGALATFILSHPHADHAGGAATIVRALRPATFWDAAFVAPSASYLGVLEAVDAAGTSWQRVRPGDSLAIDGVVLTFLAPDSAWTASLNDPNSASVVVMARFGSVRFLLVGDAERAEEEWLLGQGADLRADVLKVGHHGSRTSSTDAFLDAVSPRVAVISVGAGNTYGHPSGEVLEALSDRGTDVLRTDLMGSIVLRTDGRRLRVIMDGGSWDVVPRF